MTSDYAPVTAAIVQELQGRLSADAGHRSRYEVTLGMDTRNNLHEMSVLRYEHGTATRTKIEARYEPLPALLSIEAAIERAVQAAETKVAELEAARPDCLVPSHGRVMSDPPRAIAALVRRLEQCYDKYVAISALRHYFPKMFADYAGRKAEVAAVTAAAMRGEIDWPESLRRRVAALAGLLYAILLPVCGLATVAAGLATSGWQAAKDLARGRRTSHETRT